MKMEIRFAIRWINQGKKHLLKECHCSVSWLTISVQNYRPNLFSLLFQCFVGFCFDFFFPRKSLMFLKHSTGTLESCEWTANTQKNLPICSSPFLFLWDPIFLYSLGELSSLVTDFALASSPAEKLSAEWPELVWEPLLCTPGLCWSKKKVHGLEKQGENGHC